MQREVLIVEDSSTQALQLGLFLKQEGLDVTAVRHGRDGVEMATCRPPAVVVLDVDLPDIDGFEVCRRLKQHPATAGIPVIMLTVKDRAYDAVIGLEAGADACIPKDSFAEANLIEALRDLKTVVAGCGEVLGKEAVTDLGMRKIDLSDSIDVVMARQTAREMARELGFSLTDQTRIAIAVSEVARQALSKQGGGSVTFAAVMAGASHGLACTCLSGECPKLSLDISKVGSLSQVERLMDDLELEPHDGEGVAITMHKWLK